MANGLRWCSRHKDWHLRSHFGSDASGIDGISSSCLASRRQFYGKTYLPVPPDQRRPMGPPAAPARDGDRLQARQRINVEVRTGRRPRPRDLPCVDCGHVYSANDPRRHEYDHYLGYTADHHLDVEPVCTLCHRKRSERRGETVQIRGQRGRFVAQTRR